MKAPTSLLLSNATSWLKSSLPLNASVTRQPYNALIFDPDDFQSETESKVNRKLEELFTSQIQIELLSPGFSFQHRKILKSLGATRKQTMSAMTLDLMKLDENKTSWQSQQQEEQKNDCESPSIRRAAIEDVDRCLNVLEVDDPLFDRKLEQELLEKRMQHATTAVYLLDANSHDIGIFTTHHEVRTDKSVAQPQLLGVYDLQIQPEFQNRGFASQALRWLSSRARAQGFSWLGVFTSTDLVPFYQQNQFSELVEVERWANF